jgi:hypothetical protein
MKKKSLEIRWQPARGRLPKWTWAGHGVCIARAMDRDGEPLAAFVEGFGWLHGYTNKVVVHFDPKLMPPDKQQFAAFKAAVESSIRSRDLAFSEIAPGYWTGVNG